MDDAGDTLERLDALLRLSWAGPSRRTEACGSRGLVRRAGQCHEAAGWRRPASVRRFGRAPTLAELAYWVRHAFGEDTDRPRFPSAGAVYGLELSVIMLPDGAVHRISPAGLVRPVLVEDPIVQDPGALFFHQIRGSCAVLVIDADFDAYAAAYQIRGYRYLLLEAGHLGQELLRTLSLDGWRTCPLGAFWDDGLRRALALGLTRRAPVYAMAVGQDE